MKPIPVKFDRNNKSQSPLNERNGGQSFIVNTRKYDPNSSN